MMKSLICAISLLICCFVSTPAKAGRSRVYKQYKLAFQGDSMLFVVDTVAMDSVQIHLKFIRPQSAYFLGGNIQLGHSDLKALFAVDGRCLLRFCYRIHWDEGRQVYSAYDWARQWIFLNSSGDTISQGKAPRNLFVPQLGFGLNPAPDLLGNPNRPSRFLWGYLGDDGQWIIPPIADEAYPLKDGKAWYRVDDTWNAVDANGRMVHGVRTMERPPELAKSEEW